MIGLGYAGLPLAVEFGKHRPMVGFDVSSQRVEAGDLQAALHLNYAADPYGLADARIYIVAVPTLFDRANRPGVNLLERTSEAVGRVLKPGDIVVYVSTIYPSVTREVCTPVLERLSGFLCNQDFFVGYSPEGLNPRDKCPPLAPLRQIEGAPRMKAIRELLPRLPGDVASTYADVGTLMTATAIGCPRR